MRILVTGACGLLGAHLMELLSRRHEVVGTDRNPWWGDASRAVVAGDLLDPRFVDEFIGRTAPQALLHCTAMTDVEACERDPEAARVQNAGVPRRLLGLLPADCLFVYLSTDAVFGGSRPMATEEDPPSPCSVYGRSKLEGEEAVRRRPNSLIVRSNFYGWSSGRKKTFAEWLWGALERGEPLTLFEDFLFSPIYVADLAERLELLMEKNGRGVIHLAGRDRVSKSRFGLLLAEIAGLSHRSVRTGSVQDAGLLAVRGGDQSLDSSRFCRVTHVDLPGCREGLERFVEDRGRPLSGRFAAAAAHSARTP